MAKKPQTSAPSSTSPAPASLLERVPPHSIEAEMSLLGSMMADRQAMGEAILIVKPDDFYQPVHRQVATVLLELYDRNIPVDMVTTLDALKTHGWLEEVGGIPYLARLSESVPSAANAEHYARIVKSKSVLRSFIGTTGELIRDAYGESENVEEFLDRAEERIFQVTELKTTGRAVAMSEVLKITWDEIGKSAGQGMTGLATDFIELDNILGGLQKGEMVVLAARPSVGKTALAMNIAEHITVRHKAPAVFFSLEMRNTEIAKRMLSTMAQVNSRAFREVPSDEMLGKIQSAMNELAAAKLFIDDTPAQTILDIRAKCRRLKVQHDIQLVIIDYLQLMSHRQAENRQVQVAEISRGIKALARELDIPVLALSQLNREVEQQNRMPRVSDIRESGAVEQDADVVLLLHKYTPEEMQRESLPCNSMLLVAKNRNGPTGLVPMNFQPEYVRFVSAETRYAEG
jgi:replicative DNA helicase